MRFSSNEFASGWLAGAAGVLVSHPLDTLRVRVQAARSSTLQLEVRRLLVSEEGWRGLWRGLASPVLLVGVWKAIMFSASAWTQSLLAHRGDGRATGAPTPLWHVFAGGYVAGAAGLAVQMPMERVKCVAQASPELAIPPTIRGEAVAAAAVLRTEGLAGLYRGTLINMTLCPPAIAIWFGTNELMLRRADELAAPGGMLEGVTAGRGRSSVGVQLVCGGMGGVLAWAINYPSDRAKACVQIGSAHRPGASSLDILRPYLREEGWRFFVRGMPATLLRAVPQCGVTICVQARAAELFAEKGER